MINSFEKTTGIKLNYKMSGRRAGDIEKIWAETTKANEVLGWKAEKNIDDMTSSHWNFEKSYRDSFKIKTRKSN